MRTRIRVLGAMMAVLMATTFGIGSPQPAVAAYDCDNVVHNGVGADGASDTTNTNLNGVAGTIYVPPFTNANLYGQVTTIADIAMIIQDSVIHFFQIGWYVGSTTTGLPNTSTPKFFAGEGVVLPSVNETLTPLGSATGGTWHAFKIAQDENSSSSTFRKYRGYIDNVHVWTSSMTTTIEGTPRMLGETNFDCADMYAHASTSSGGPTLQAHHANSTWSNWQQHLNISFGEPATTPSCWNNTRVNGYTATVLANDQC